MSDSKNYCKDCVHLARYSNALTPTCRECKNHDKYEPIKKEGE